MFGSNGTICLITSSNIFEGAIGGEGKYSILLYQWLKSNNIKSILLGNQFTKIRSYEGDIPSLSSKKKKDTNLRRIPYVIYVIYRLITALKMTIQIIKLNRKSKIALIHSQDTGYSGLAALFAGRILHIPVIVSTHGIRHRTITLSLYGLGKKILGRMEYLIDIHVVKKADFVISDNNFVKNYFEKLCQRKIEQIPIPIFVDNYKYSIFHRKKFRKEFSINESTRILGYIGRMVPEKNIQTLINAFSDVLRSYPEMKLVLIGSGPCVNDILELTDKLGITKYLLFLGTKSNINELLSGIDIFVLPSFTEGMSMALLEAMANGRSIICSNIESNAELIKHCYHGLLINPYSIESLRKAITKLIREEDTSKFLQKNAQAKAQNFDINQIFPRILKVYNEAIQ